MARSGISAVLVLAAALGCASSRGSGPAVVGQPQPVAAASPASAQPRREGAMLICENERPTGSNIPQRVCRPADDKAARESAQEFLRHPRGNPRQGD